MKWMKKVGIGMLSAAMLCSTEVVSQAHSGRTDSAGGHHDYKNVSGLGYYHYHHGYPAHLHPNGVCSYTTSTTVPTTTATPTTKPKPITLNSKKATLQVGQQKKLKLKNASGKIKWVSSKPGVAKVNKYGKVTAKKKGKTVITASCQGKKYKCTIKVQAPYISKTTLDMEAGDFTYITMKGTSKDYTWRTTNDQVAEIGYDGEIFAVSPGKAEVYTKIAGVRYSCVVTVYESDEDEL